MEEFFCLHDLHQFCFSAMDFRVIKSVWIVDFHLVISTDSKLTIQSNQEACYCLSVSD